MGFSTGLRLLKVTTPVSPVLVVVSSGGEGGLGAAAGTGEGVLGGAGEGADGATDVLGWTGDGGAGEGARGAGVGEGGATTRSLDSPLVDVPK